MSGDHWKEAEPEIYRYSVRCGRSTAQAIAKAADRAGLTVNAFVQQHFETLFSQVSGGKKAPQADVAAGAGEKREDLALAQRHGVTPGAIKVYRLIESLADGEGMCQIGADDIAARTGFGAGSVRVFLSNLVTAELLARTRNGGFRGVSAYRVLGKARVA